MVVVDGLYGVAGFAGAGDAAAEADELPNKSRALAYQNMYEFLDTSSYSCYGSDYDRARRDSRR